jgi:hypothetical protein
VAVIQSGAGGGNLLTIDGVSKAARVTLYDASGNLITSLGDVVLLSQTLGSLNAAVVLSLSGQSGAALQITGTTGSVILSFEATVDNNEWFGINGVAPTTGHISNSTDTDGQWLLAVAGYTAVRARVSYLNSGSMTVSMRASQGSQLSTEANTVPVSPNQGLANTVANGWPVKITDGYNVLGTLTNPVKVDGSNFPQTISGSINIEPGTNPIRIDPIGTTSQPITAASLPLPSGASTETTLSSRLADSTFTGRINTLGQKTGSNSTPVVIASDQSSIPVSGTITANAGSGSFTVVQSTAANLNATVSGTITSNIGTTNGLALDATITGGTQRTKITDGTNNVALSNSSPAGTEQGLIVRNIPSGTQTISGTVSATQSGTWTVQPGNTANTTPWLSTINQGGNSATVSAGGALKIDGSATTQPISGTITANAGSGTFAVSASSLPLPSGAATETTLGARLADTTFTTRINTQGQKTMATSTPVVIASDQASFPVSGSGNFTIVQATAANLNATVSGTITANIGTSGSLALDTSITGLQVSQASTTSGQKGSLTQAAVSTSAPSYTTGQTNPLSLTTTGLLRVDGSGATQPISGSITANIGTTNGLALDATLTGGTVKSINRGGAKGSTVAADITSVSIDANTQALHVQLAGQGAVGTPIRIDPTGTTTQPVSGTITANAGTGSFTVAQATAANLNATITGTVTSNIGTTNGIALDATLAKLTVAQGTAIGSNTQALVGGSVSTSSPSYTTGNINPFSLTTSGALRVDASSTTQPISGAITANIGTSGSLALDATLTGGTQRNKITDGTNNAAVKAASTAAIATDPALVVAISPNNTVTVAGTVTASNPSVSTTSTSPPGSATYIGGSTTTAAPTYTTGQMNALSLTTAGALRIDGSATTQPISGTITANQGGTWTVQPGNTANTTPWLSTINQGGNSATVSAGGALKIDGSAVTQPVSGTITANAGTGTFAVSGTVTSNIGTTNGLALDTTISGLQVSQGSTTSGQKGAVILGAVTTAAPTYTTAQSSPISLTTAGAIRIDGSASTQPVSGTVATTQSGTWTMQPGNTANTTPWLSTISQGGNSATVSAGGALKVDGSTSTQPISASSLPLPTGASTETTLGTRLADATFTGRINTQGQKAMSASTPVVIASDQSAVLISNVAVISAGNSSIATLAGAATFTGTSDSSLGYQSIVVNVMAIGASAPAGTLRVEQSSDGSNWDIRDDFAVDGGTASPTGSFDIDIGLIASNFRISYINGATAQTAFRLQTLKFPIKTSLPNSATRKGIQSQTFLPVQSAKDTGRVAKVYTATAVAGVTTEALITLTPLSDFVAGSTGTSFAVTAGKRLRLQGMSVTWRSATAAAGSVILRFRVSNTGAVTASTAISAALGVTQATATAGFCASSTFTFPDGFELSGTMQLGITQLASAAATGLDFELYGYEY